ncbi:MAG: UDPGP type 1 family protein [Clostridia bacterium]|nr:UDPGP type 1 family protein [Clostridia bacterium]
MRSCLTDKMDLPELKEKLIKYGQPELAEIIDAAETVSGIDLELVSGLYRMASSGDRTAEEGDIAPIPVTVEDELDRVTRERYIRAGERLIRTGGFAAVTMAGGQGTRLGHNGPKGTYDIGVDEHSLFEIQARRLLRRAAISGGAQIPWYIMTSGENDSATKAFFEANGYFGYAPENVRFFKQFMLPMVGFDGRIIRDSFTSVKMGADGHGGVFRAMQAGGVIEDMKARGVRYAFIGGIDNVLVKLCDPLFIGFAYLNDLPCAGKSLIKRDPFEKAGVFCLKNGRPYVVEYTEISEEMARATDEAGNYIYGDAHILCNIFRIDTLEDAAGRSLPYHVAVKKTRYVDANGEITEPEKPNAYKFEAFIFDAFSRCDNMGILRVKREYEFAPVKNREGEDSPATARELYESAKARGKLD